MNLRRAWLQTKRWAAVMGFSFPDRSPSACSFIIGNGRSSKYSANFLRSKSGSAAGVRIPARSVCPRNGLR
eukprot:3746643-Alexandrium_andersonii.AAC.1